MKKNIQTVAVFLLSFLSVAFSIQAQTSEFEVNGLKVIHKKVPKAIVSARLFVDGGAANYTINKSGIESFAFQLAVTGGTQSMDKIAYSTKLEQLGTKVNASSGYDYGQFSLRCIQANWDASWDLFADAIINPKFDEEQFAILKEQIISSIKQNDNDPDKSLEKLALGNVFEGKNYEKSPAGTEASINSLTLDELKNYYKNILGKKRSFLVVVGDITQDDLKAKIAKSFAKLPKGTLPQKEDRVMFNAVNNKIENRDIATNYIMGIMNAPKFDTEDGAAMMVAMSILSSRYFIELRTKRSLSYAPYSSYVNSRINDPYNIIYISTLDPKQSMEIMVNEINDIRENGFKESELTNKKLSFLTKHYMGQETLDSQSQSLGTNELRGGWEISDKFTDLVNSLTIDDINRVMNKYTDIIQWNYLGKEDMVAEKYFLQPNKMPNEVNLKGKK